MVSETIRCENINMSGDAQKFRFEEVHAPSYITASECVTPKNHVHKGSPSALTNVVTVGAEVFSEELPNKRRHDDDESSLSSDLSYQQRVEHFPRKSSSSSETSEVGGAPLSGGSPRHNIRRSDSHSRTQRRRRVKRSKGRRGKSAGGRGQRQMKSNKAALAKERMEELEQIFGPRWTTTGMRGKDVLRLKVKTLAALAHIVGFVVFLDQRLRLKEVSCPPSTKTGNQCRGFLLYLRTETVEQASHVKDKLFEEYCSMNLDENQKGPFGYIELNPLSAKDKKIQDQLDLQQKQLEKARMHQLMFLPEFSIVSDVGGSPLIPQGNGGHPMINQSNVGGGSLVTQQNAGGAFLTQPNVGGSSLPPGYVLQSTVPVYGMPGVPLMTVPNLPGLQPVPFQVQFVQHPLPAGSMQFVPGMSHQLPTGDVYSNNNSQMLHPVQSLSPHNPCTPMSSLVAGSSAAMPVPVHSNDPNFMSHPHFQ